MWSNTHRVSYYFFQLPFQYRNIFILFQKNPFRSVRQRFLFPLLSLVSPSTRRPRFAMFLSPRRIENQPTPPRRTHEYFKGPLPANDSPSRSSSPSAVFSTFATTGSMHPCGKNDTDRERAFTIAIPWFFKDGQRVSGRMILLLMQFNELYFKSISFFKVLYYKSWNKLLIEIYKIMNKCINRCDHSSKSIIQSYWIY